MEIMVITGEGIGPEIMKSALDILDRLKENFQCNVEPILYEDINAASFEKGKLTLEDITNEARKYKAILKAPLGNPNIRNKDSTEAGLDIILGLRFNLDLFANLRPVKLLPGVPTILKGYDDGKKTIDYTIVRENTEGLYSSHFGGLVLRDEVAIDNQTITRKGTERISKFAFELAKKTRRKNLEKRTVTCVDKSNVLKSSYFFRKIFDEVAQKYHTINHTYMYADAMAQYMILNADKVDVVVTENMFGDLHSDLGSATVGGLGLAPGANLSEKFGMFEPVHGSAPDTAEKGIADPTAMILSTAMMPEWLGFQNEPNFVEKALCNVLERSHEKSSFVIGGAEKLQNFNYITPSSFSLIISSSL